MAEAIQKQVEYYFGDINLPRDKFLQEEMKKEDGWIDLSTMLKFNRLSKLSQDIEAIANALAESSLIEVSEDKHKIRRNPEFPLPPNTLEYWQEIKRRTVYVKGFPLETTLDEIQEFVNPHGDIKNILMRRMKKEKSFKGSIFVTFADKESAEKFANDTETSKFNGNELVKLMQDAYWLKKTQETKEKRQYEKELKRQKQAEQKKEHENAIATNFVKGSVLEVSGLGDHKHKYDDIKVFFKKFGDVAFVAYETGNDKAQIRFNAKEEGTASAAWEKAKSEGDGKVIYGEQELSAKILDGAEEEAYWAEFSKNKIAKNDRSQKNRGQKRRGDRNQRDRIQAKHKKFDEDDDVKEEIKTEDV